MSELNINVSPEKLMKFSSYVSDFKSYMDVDCHELLLALQHLKSISSKEEMNSIIMTVNKISDIIDSAQPTLKELVSKIDEYTAFVKRLKIIANSN